VNPTSDAAERALRGAVVIGKTSFGSRSKRGAHAFARLLSIIMTWECQGKDFFTTAHQALVGACSQNWCTNTELVHHGGCVVVEAHLGDLAILDLVDTSEVHFDGSTCWRKKAKSPNVFRFGATELHKHLLICGLQVGHYHPTVGEGSVEILMELIEALWSMGDHAPWEVVYFDVVCQGNGLE
jgi:hypothetical protein